MLLEVGRVARAHGLKGEVIVELFTDRPERVARGSVLTLGGAVPRTLEVRAATRMGGPHGSGRPARDRWIVSFQEIRDRQGAEGLRAKVLLAPPIEDPGAVWVHQLIGARVLDVDGAPLGVVCAVEANPASDLLVLDTGGLVPMCFMTDTASEPGTVVVDIPDGLLD